MPPAAGPDPESGPAAAPGFAPASTLRHRRGGAGCDPCGVLKRTVNYQATPNVCHFKTVPKAWAALRSRWRYAHAAAFAVGPPLHLLARVWPPLLANMAIFCIVAADHALDALAAANPGTKHVSIFPSLAASVAASLDPAYRLALFAVALLLTLRLGRVYERWWAARVAFAQLGSACIQAAGRTAGWAGEAEADAVARWAVTWHFSLWQLLTESKTPHPVVQHMLTPAEYAVFAASDKPRQVALVQITRLLEKLVRKRPELCVPVYTLLDRGATAAGVCSGIKFQALPIAITYTCTGFLELFLFTYPLTGLSKGPAAPGASAAHAHDTDVTSVIFTLAVQAVLFFILNILFLGADEVASMMENPFGEIPLEAMAKTTPRDVVRVLAEGRALAAMDRGGDPAAAAAGKGVGFAGGTGEDWDKVLYLCRKEDR